MIKAEQYPFSEEAANRPSKDFPLLLHGDTGFTVVPGKQIQGTTPQDGTEKWEQLEKLLLLLKCPHKHGCSGPARFVATWRLGAPGGAIKPIYCRAMARTEVQGLVLGSPMRLVV